MYGITFTHNLPEIFAHLKHPNNLICPVRIHGANLILFSFFQTMPSKRKNTGTSDDTVPDEKRKKLDMGTQTIWAQKNVHILSLDGGGARGIMESIMLGHIMSFATLMAKKPTTVLNIGLDLGNIDRLVELTPNELIHPTKVFDYIVGKMIFLTIMAKPFKNIFYYLSNISLKNHLLKF